MELDALTSLVSTVGAPLGFAIMGFVALFKIISSYKVNVDKQLEEWKKRDEKRDEDLDRLVEKYHEDYAKVTEALNNNTNAMNTLSRVVEGVVGKQFQQKE